ncbi:MAG: hypothetical protein U9N49_01605 [Campylobacterota bacterium]|nr:hypothetical protein [Campylobacterota bacterium]
MESMTITIGIIVFIWVVSFYMFQNKKQKIKEQKQRRLEEYQDQLGDLTNILENSQNSEYQKATIDKPTTDQTNTETTIENKLKENQKSNVESKPIATQQSNQKRNQASVEYREYLSQRYQKLGYNIWEHNKEQRGIDIIAKKEKELLIMASTYRDKKDKQKVGINEIKAFRIDASDFIELNPLFGNYKLNLLFILSDELLDDQAKEYIKKLQSQDRAIDYKVIPF